MTGHRRAKSAPARPLPWALAPLLTDALLLSLLLVGVLRFSIHVYPLSVGDMPVVGPCVLAGTVSAVVWSLGRYRRRAALLCALALSAAVLLLRQQLFYGAKACLEVMSDFMEETIDFPWQYSMKGQLPPAEHRAAAEAFLTFLTVLLAFLLGWAAVRVRSALLAVALTLPWLMPAFLAEVEEDLDWLAVALVFAVWGALLLSGLSGRKNRRAAAPAALLALLTGLMAIWGICALFPLEGYTQPQWAAEAREELLALEWFPGGEEASSQQPGTGPGEPAAPARMDFSSAGPRRYTGREVFRVDATHSGTLYLRGAVYEHYTDDAWEGEVPAQVEDGGTPAADGAQEAVVTWRGSPSTAVYVPYGVVSVEGVAVSENRTLAFPEARETYTVDYLPLEGEPENAGLAGPGAGADIEDCLAVPGEIARALEAWYAEAARELSDSGISPAGDAVGDYAFELNTAERIAQLLARNASYDLLTPRTPEGEDFVIYFLEESHRGYCVHFASAAALLLRLEGIPARYASGYTASLSPGSTSGNFARVLDSDAHAWVEIYLEGYGWYPVEVTPASGDVPEPETPATTEPETSATPEPTLQPTPEPQESETPAATATPSEESPVLEESEDPEQEGGSVWPWWALGLLAVPAALALTWGLRRRSWKRMCRGRDANAAVLAAYGWFQTLAHWGGRTGEETETLARKARFSQHALTEQERKAVLARLRGEISRLKKELPIWRRWVLRLLFPADRSSR